MLPIIDTHLHVWDLTRFDLPWLAGDPTLNRSFSMADYLDATQSVNLDKAIYMEVAVAPDQQRREVDAVVEMCEASDNPTVAAVVGGQPGRAGFRDYVGTLAGIPCIKGVREVNPAGAACRDGAFHRDIQLLGEQGLSFDICAQPAALADCLALIEACPGTRFILDHCGNARAAAFAAGADAAQRAIADQWRRDIAGFAACEHAVCKISGIVEGAEPGWRPADLAPIVNHCLDEFGPDRVMFAANWPVCTPRASLAEWVDALREIVAPRPEADQRKLFHDNAESFYLAG